LIVLRVVLRVGRRGVLVIPKALRERVGIEEGGLVEAEVVGDSIVLRPLKPLAVDIDPNAASHLIAEEKRRWEDRLKRVTGETST